MYAVVVTFTIKADEIDKFMPLMIENARVSKEIEPGCQLFDVCRGDEPNVVFLYEIYDNDAAFQDHLASDHFQRFDKAVADMVASKSVQLFHEVSR